MRSVRVAPAGGDREGSIVLIFALPRARKALRITLLEGAARCSDRGECRLFTVRLPECSSSCRAGGGRLGVFAPGQPP